MRVWFLNEERKSIKFALVKRAILVGIFRADGVFRRVAGGKGAPCPEHGRAPGATAERTRLTKYPPGAAPLPRRFQYRKWLLGRKWAKPEAGFRHDDGIFLPGATDLLANFASEHIRHDGSLQKI